MILSASEYIRAAILAFIVILTPIHGILLAIFLLVMFDTMTGIVKALNKKEYITSRKLSIIVSKCLLYFTAIIVIYFVDEHITNSVFKMWFSCEYLLSKLLGIMIVIIEITSIGENIQAISGFSFGKFFRTALRRIKDVKSEVDEFRSDDWISKDNKRKENEEKNSGL